VPVLRRRQQLVDRKLQFYVAMPIVSALGGIALLYTLAVFVLPESAVQDTLGSKSTQEYLLIANGAYFVIGTAIVMVLALYLMFRVAGPAFVVERALRAFASGDLEQRLSLRKGDQLQSLAEAAAELRDKIRADRDAHREELDEIAKMLEAGDVEGAKRAIESVRGDSPAHVAEATGTVEKPAEASC
jgi:methyl-accepting chemotaxis protein